jgi:putative Holliday junction resolvase
MAESDNRSRENDRGRVAGIDFGTTRIGIAISDPGRSIASPYENYTRRGPQQDARRMQRLVEEERVTLFVVGLPVHLDGRESQSSTRAREFGQWLHEATRVPVEFCDERFSSVEAEQFLLDANLSRKRRKARIDMLAAQILLSSYLESAGSSPQGPGPLDQ